VAGVAYSSAQSVLAQTERILSSPQFSRSETLSRLLRFIVELTLDGKTNELKEYRLGVDVLGRGKNFDPRIDPIVRMQAAKLRSRLAEYYDNEGRADPIVISIPKGGYVPTFTTAEISRPYPERDTTSQQVHSIAVLPFVSMSGDPENEYFSDGLTEELINALTYIPGLRVVARTSAFCFKNATKDVREIGAQLNVRTVLEGSVRKAGKQLRVTAQLIDVSTGYHLLSQTFRREMNDVFAVQEDSRAPSREKSCRNIEVKPDLLYATTLLISMHTSST
jgi:TolB-like protein